MDTNELEKKNILQKVLVGVLLIIVISLISVGMYAWARYTTNKTGINTSNVAKWYFDLKNGGTRNSIETDMVKLIDTSKTYDYVESNRMAPGMEGEFELIVDTEGTETDVIYDIDITLQQCPSNLLIYRVTGSGEDETETLLSGNSISKQRTINISEYLTHSKAIQPVAAEDSRRIKLKWVWPYQTNEFWWGVPTTEQISDGEELANDKIDTEDQGMTTTMRIFATGMEAIGRSISSAIIKNGDTVLQNGGEAVNLKVGDEFQITIESNDPIEAVTYSSTNEAVATVNSSGKVKAVGPGTAQIKIQGDTDSVVINVKVKQDVKTSYYGEKVNYSVTVDGTELNDWKIFYEDTDNDKIYVIYGDYLPYSAYSSVNNISEITNGNSDYAIRATNRTTLINTLKTQSYWEHLLRGKSTTTGNSIDLKAKGATITGSPTLEQFIASWNKKYPTQKIYKITTATVMDDGYYGYYVSTTNDPPTTSEYSASISNLDVLYYPHTSAWNDTYGYWLASPSAYGIDSVMFTNFLGSVYHNGYGSTNRSCRPLMILSSDLLTRNANEEWDIVETSSN